MGRPMMEAFERRAATKQIRARPNPDLKFLGVVITLYDRRTNLARDVKSQIQSVFGDKVFRTTISKKNLEYSPVI